MSSASRILRRRRRMDQQSQKLSILGRGALIFCTACLAGILSLAMYAGLLYSQLLMDLPSPVALETQFQGGEGGFLPRIQVFDRSGEHLGYSLLHPAAANRKWVTIEPGANGSLPQHVLQSIIVAQDESYWTNSGYGPDYLLELAVHALDPDQNPLPRPSITQQLVEMTLLSPEELKWDPVEKSLRSLLVAARLSRWYSKEQILEWYINSAYFGNLAFGIDAASMVYFGKHAQDLTLGEAAMLASIPSGPGTNPRDAPGAARAKQVEVLAALARKQAITASEHASALATAIDLASPTEETSFAVERYLLERVQEALGPSFVFRSDVNIFTTLDNQLQQQVSCSATYYLGILQGQDPSTAQAMAEGDACNIVRSFPPLRPGDIGVNHQVREAAVVILDVGEGEIRALLGSVNEGRAAEEITYPFLYLSALRRGYSPGTMLLDLPLGRPGDLEGLLSREEMHGPTRLRMALIGNYPYAALRTIRLIGADVVHETMRKMGLRGEIFSTNGEEGQLGWSPEASLLDLTYAYGVFASGGSRGGVAAAAPQAQSISEEMKPILIRKATDDEDNILYEVDPSTRIILSESLAYLMTDVLADAATRRMIYRSTSVFELDRPVAVKTGLDPSTAHSWAVGYTPSYVVGVWLGNSDGTPMQQIDDINGAAPLWNVLTRLVGEDSTKAGWELPRGIVSVEVCDPSGLLPTEHCPNIVSELYLEGTEPAQVDNLYQPFRVNKETGKIATLHTPLDQVEELVFLIPPPEAEAWAELVNLDQPPREYDILADGANDLDEGGISSPGPFELSNGRIWITGTAETENFEYYRLQFGKGLNPTVWYQIGDDVDEPVREGTLGLWDTAGLNGLYTLQLMVIDNDGVLSRSYQHITIDNQPPQLEVLNPKPGQTFRMGGQASVLIEARADDPFGISKVEILVDDKIAAEIVEPPYLLSLPVAEAGEHAISVLAYDLAGNRAESTPIRISILP